MSREISWEPTGSGKLTEALPVTVRFKLSSVIEIVMPPDVGNCMQSLWPMLDMLAKTTMSTIAVADPVPRMFALACALGKPRFEHARSLRDASAATRMSLALMCDVIFR